MTRTIAIDLGSANTRAGIFDGDQLKIFRDENNNDAVPSYVAFTHSGVSVGKAALNHLYEDPSNTVYDIVRLLGRNFFDPVIQMSIIEHWPFKVIPGEADKAMVLVHCKGKEWQLSPEQICSIILMEIKKIAESNLGCAVTSAVIAVPVYFNHTQRKALKYAGHIAGLNVKKLISTPVAAAIFYGLERIPRSTPTNFFEKLFFSPPVYNLLVFDLGAGTLDVSIVTVKKDKFTVLATAGDIHLGGNTIDNKMVDYIVNELNIQNKDINMGKIRGACERVKVGLSYNETIVLKKNENDLGVPLDFYYVFTKALFNQLNKEFVSRCIEIMDACLKEAKMCLDKIHHVILAGASTRIPLLEEQIRQHFCRNINLNISEPREHTATYGAAILAYQLSCENKYKDRDLSLTDATPFSLGIRTTQTQGVGHIIFPKNTPIPTRNVEQLIDSNHHNQQIPFLRVYEGENDLLASIELFGVESTYPGSKCKVCSEIDAHGVITISVTDTLCRKKNSITIGRSNDILQEVVEDSQKLLQKILENEEEHDTTESLKLDAIESLGRDAPESVITIGRSNDILQVVVEDSQKLLEKILGNEEHDTTASLELDAMENPGRDTLESVITIGSSIGILQAVGDSQKLQQKDLENEKEHDTAESLKLDAPVSPKNDTPESLKPDTLESPGIADSKGFAIGIDLGTTKSCVGIWWHNRVEIIANELGNRTTQSCVSFRETERLVGDAAKNATNTIMNVKRLMGRHNMEHNVQKGDGMLPLKVKEGSNVGTVIAVHYKGEEKVFRPEEITAMILMKMKEQAERETKTEIKNVVITVPSCFSNSQRKATRDAGIIAGLNVMQLLNEPTAVAIAYYLQKSSPESFNKKNVMVFDLGGGTLDVSILTISNEKIEVLSVVGESNFGGEDFDTVLVNYLVERVNKTKTVPVGKSMSDNPRSLRRLRAACEKAKRDLSTTPKTRIEIDSLYEEINFETTITKDEYEQLISGLIDRCMETVKTCLTNAKVDKTDIDDVILVGGSTRIPMMQEALQKFYGEKLCKSINQDEAIAYGAAILAAKLSGNDDNKFQGLEICDVTSLPVCIATGGDELELLVPRYSPIPVQKDMVFTTSKDGQSEIQIALYESELSGTIIKDELMGKFVISGIPQTRGSPKISVSFSIDSSGILSLSAHDKGAELAIKEIESLNLTIEDIREMIKVSEELKINDANQKKKVDAMNSLEEFALKMMAMQKIDAPKKKEIDEAANEILDWIQEEPNATIEEVNKRKQQLETLCDNQ